MLESVNLSSDGSRAVFQYCDGSPKKCSIGSLDLRNNTLHLIPNPEGKQFFAPSFLGDSEKILAAVACAVNCRGYDKYQSQIVIINPETGGITQITVGPSYRIFPVSQPGSDNVLVVSRRILEDGGAPVALGRYELTLINSTKHIETPILKERDGFNVFLGWPSFIDTSTVVFMGIAPITPEIQESVKKLNKGSGKVATIAYRLQFDSLPELLPENGGPTRPGIPEISGLSASKDGGKIVFIDLSKGEPHTKNIGFNYELFISEAGEIRQVTNLRTYIGHVHISYDGRFVAFLADETRQKKFDLFILDLKTSEIKEIHLKEMLASAKRDTTH